MAGRKNRRLAGQEWRKRADSAGGRTKPVIAKHFAAARRKDAILWLLKDAQAGMGANAVPGGIDDPRGGGEGSRMDEDEPREQR